MWDGVARVPGLAHTTALESGGEPARTSSRRDGGLGAAPLPPATGRASYIVNMSEKPSSIVGGTTMRNTPMTIFCVR